MEALPPNATVEEIEAEIAFGAVMLQTLDEEDIEYSARKTEYEAALSELHRRLDLSSPHLNPPTTPSHPRRSPGEQHLVSRDRSATLQAPIIHSPLGHHQHNNGMGNSGEASTSSSLSSTSHNRKRPRNVGEGWSFSNVDDQTTSRKAPRLGLSPTPSTASTTSDSVEALENSLSFDISANRDRIVKRIQEQQRQTEFRIKQEREDAKYAKEYAEALQQSIQAQPSTSSGQQAVQRTQSRLGSDGHVTRPLPPYRPSVPVHTPVVNYQIPPEYIKPESHRLMPASQLQSANRQALQMLTAMNAGSEVGHSATLENLGRGVLRYGNSDDENEDDDDDDDLEEISPAQFASTRGLAPSLHAAPFSSYAGMSNAWGNGTSRSVPPGIYVPPRYGANPMIGGTSVYNTQNAGGPSQSLFGPALTSLQSTVGRWAEGFDTVAGLINGMIPPKLQEGNPSAMRQKVDLGVGGLNPSHVRDFDADIHARGLDYMLSDPARTREELEQLLENIRPDEDIPPEMRVGTPDGLGVALMEHQKLGLAWLTAQEEGSNKGGILADDMGLGKTIQALALIVSRKSTDRARKTTLIVAPVALLRQWKEEIDEKVSRGHKLKTYIYHGAKSKDTFATLSTYDVVLTTFGKVAGEYGRKEAFRMRKAMDPAAIPRPAEKLVLLAEEARWYRVIIDEAQCIKNKSTKAALGASYLNAIYRLCMTGTPMMNNVGELYSLIHFLRIPPYNELERFNREFKRPLSGSSEYLKNRAMRALQALLKAILLRRTKKSEIDGRPILNLPERTTEIVHAVFDEDQQQFYTALETETQLAVNKYLQKGKMGKNYSYILVRLLRLRQACCHPHLIKDFAEDGPGDIPIEDMKVLAKSFEANVVERIKKTNGNFECPICYDATENPTIFFPCGHDVCSECFAKITDPSVAIANGSDGGVEAKCPECRSKVDPKKVINWTAFKKVHLPEECAEEEAEAKDEAADSDTDSESDESDQDSDADSQGDLRDFIVNDEEVEEAETEDDVENVEAPENKRTSSSRVVKKTSKSALSRKAKGKGKAPKKEKKTMAQLKKESLRNAKAKKRYLRRIRRQYISSAKIDKTVEVLRAVQDNDPTEKTIIFSQFTSLLDLLEVPIDDEGWKYRRYDGSMSANMRAAAVNDFKDKDLNVKIMLVSLKAGNAGLNLTAASQVIILDPFWNPFIEEQAIDRAHRIGQKRPVQVHRILVENTVEDRIIVSRFMSPFASDL